jgi:hypothetical protein
MIRVEVFAKSPDGTRASNAMFFVDSEGEVASAVWRAACLIDLGGSIDAWGPVSLWGAWAKLDHVPRPVLRVYWRVYPKRARGNAERSIERATLEEAEDTALVWRKAKRFDKITRVTVRPKRAK